MRPVVKFILVFFILSWGNFTFAQNDKLQWLDSFMESLPEELMEESSFEELQSYFINLIENPLDLNLVSEDQLNSLLFISPLQVQKIIQYRTRLNGFLSIYELQSVEGLSLEDAFLLSYFLKVKDDYFSPSKEEMVSIKRLKTELFVQAGKNIQINKGLSQKNTDKSHYVGDAWKSLVKLKIENPQIWKIQINFEKDPGEKWWNPQFGQKIDFISMGFQMPKWGRWENLILGNYGVQIGEGLGLWMGFASSKGAIFHGVAKSDGQARMHTGVNEVNYLRGATAELNWNGMRFQPYLSFRQFDSSVKNDEEGNPYASSIMQSGLHRTQTEISNHKSLNHYLGGLHVQKQISSLRLGLNYFYSRFGVPLKPDDSPRNIYKFRGNQYHNGSLYWKGTWNNIYYFGELASHDWNHLAWVSGALLALGKDFSLSFLYRNYGKSYTSLFTHAFAEQSTAQNEKGFYFGWLYQPNKYFSWINYLDIYKFPWLRFGVDKPSSGWDYMSEIKWTPQRKSLVKFRFKYEVKGENFTEEKSAYSQIVDKKQIQLKWDFNHSFNSLFELRAKYYNQNWFSHIYVLDGFYSLWNAKISLNSRFSFLHTNSEKNIDPLYVFENDVIFGHGVRPYSYPGYKYYLNLKYRLNKHHSFWINWSQSDHPEKSSLGSGLDEISGNRKQSFKLVWRWN